ncbi:recombinase family protein [Aggregatilinea lenta]|uniref:recombinase family protein n=1 Tax=Aggregatilinea lenta TaxID=913108 RepID=UPI000E5B6186|nr:recombinase family protein [Aggregatilinea lenta]
MSQNLSGRIPRKIALCYVRQSYTRDESDTNSPERQQANIQAVCNREGWIPEWYTDAEGHKSGTKVNNRPGWLAVEKRLKDPDIIALIANDSSRMHRKFWRVGYLLELLDEYGVRLVFAAPGREMDTSTHWGRMMINFMAMQDEAYAADISAKSKDSVLYRKSQGKTIGMAPFGTVRNEQGYLIPSPEGAWLLPDGLYTAGKVGDQAPASGAIWRGYYDCAQRILELYAENSHGIERIAYQITDEGWAFRNRKHQPRPVNRDDIRRVVSSWRQYAGLSPEGRGKDTNASLIDDPVGVLYDTGRAVFPLDLLRLVGEVEASRSVTTRPFGSVKASHPYPLTWLLFCAECERQAREQNNPSLRTRLSGVDQNGKLRYRHAEGVKCGCKRRSVFKDVIEADFGRLINLLTIREDRFPLLVEMAIQSEYGGPGNAPDEDYEIQKSVAIAKCRQRMENARFLLLEGDITKEEYLKRKEHNERQIAHWEARTTETEKAGIELRMCMEALDTLARLWGTANDEDKQEMARMLFEYVVYDLDKQQIVDFTLKPWASRFLELRAALYGDDDGAALPPNDDNSGDESSDDERGVSGEYSPEKHNRSGLKTTSDLCPIGASNPQLASIFGSRRFTSSKCSTTRPSPLNPRMTLCPKTLGAMPKSESVTLMAKRLEN